MIGCTFIALNGGIIMRNFKRILSIALTLLVAICVIACEKKIPDESSQSTAVVTEAENIISMDKRFKLVEGTKDNQVAYIYTLYDSYGNVVYEQTVVKEPKISYVSDNVLEICNSMGTSALSCTYFNLTTNKLSDICWNPSYVDEEIVVYMEYDEARDPDTFLVIRDVFDSTKLYKELVYDFSPDAVPANAIKSVKRIDDKLEIVYFKGENRTEVTVNVNLK